MAQAAVKHESLLAAEVEYALRSPKSTRHTDKAGVRAEEFFPSPPTPKSKARALRCRGSFGAQGAAGPASQ